MEKGTEVKSPRIEEQRKRELWLRAGGILGETLYDDVTLAGTCTLSILGAITEHRSVNAATSSATAKTQANDLGCIGYMSCMQVLAH